MNPHISVNASQFRGTVPRMLRFVPPARLALLVVVALVLGLGMSSAGSAQQSPTRADEKVVDATLVFLHGARPTRPGNCDAVVFAQWDHVGDTVSATASFTFNGKAATKTLAPPYDDTFTKVNTYTAPAGTHWIQIGLGFGDGPRPNDCADMSARQRAAFGPTATVKLTIAKTAPPVVTQVPGTGKFSRSRGVSVAKVRCPKGGSCRVTMDSPIRLRIGSRTYTLRAKVPTTVRGGEERSIGLRFNKPSQAAALAGRTATPRLKVTAVNGETEVSKVIARRVTFARSGD